MVAEGELKAVVALSEVLDAPNDYLSPELRAKFETYISEPEKISSNEFVQSYLHLKENVTASDSV